MIQVHFTDFFEVDPRALHEHGAFNVSLVGDIPLFIDPFLLFNSEKPEYQQLHAEMIRYLKFLRGKSEEMALRRGLLEAWFTFREIKQTWLGYSEQGNRGRGLGIGFARSLQANLHTIFSSFGEEQITQGSHLEKLCLVEPGVGRDTISDFTTNLIKGYLLDYTELFTVRHLDSAHSCKFSVDRVRFNYRTESWESKGFVLPLFREDFVLLTPKDILTKDDVWISRQGMVNEFRTVVEALSNDQLRAQLNNYLLSMLPDQEPTREQFSLAVEHTIRRFPQFIEYYIRSKEERGDEAERLSDHHVTEATARFVRQASDLVSGLADNTQFFALTGDTLTEARERVRYLKDVIENKGGYRAFFVDGEPIRSEKDLHVFFRLTWCGTPSDVSTEVDDGRGPADFKVSRGAWDKTIVEFKLASNRQLKRNLPSQAEVYQSASDADSAIKVIVYFSESEEARVLKILRELGIPEGPNLVLIDARPDNKPSGSRA